MAADASLWQRVGDTLAQEFSDVQDAETVTRVLLRLTLAALLGGLLGIEREAKGKDAGVRTHMLVAMGAAMFVLAAQQFEIGAADMSRVLQGVIAGVGFLGAGAILKSEGEQQVKGLTTAAGIWMTAAIGVAAGLGRESMAILATLLTLAILSALPLVGRLFERKEKAAPRIVTPPEHPPR